MVHHGGYLKYVSKRFNTFHMPFFLGGCSWKQSQCQPIIPNFCLKHRTKNERLQPGHWTCERSLVHHIYSFDAVLAGSAGSNPCPGRCCSRCRRNIVPEKKVKRPRSYGVWRMDFGKMPWCKHWVSDCKWCQTNQDADHLFSFSAFPCFSIQSSTKCIQVSSFGISCSICELWQNPRPWQWSHPVFPASIAAKVSTTVPSLRRLRSGILLADRRLEICMPDM